MNRIYCVPSNERGKQFQVEDNVNVLVEATRAAEVSVPCSRIELWTCPGANTELRQET